MESEVIAKTGKLLDAQSRWNVLIQSHHPLRIYFPSVSSADFLPSELTIQVPGIAAWVLRDGSPYYQITPIIHYVFLKLFNLPVSVLTMSCYSILSAKSLNTTVFQRSAETMTALFRASRKASFNQASRFVLLLGTETQDKVDDYYLRELLEGKFLTVREKKLPQNNKRTWLANNGVAGCKAWIIEYEFKPGLPKIGEGWQEVREWEYS